MDTEPAPAPEPARAAEPGRGDDFGPRGYLPERAAKRARKIVLREQMGQGWPLAALVAAVLVAVAGGWYLVSATGPPGAPFTAVVDLAAVESGEAVATGAGDAEILVVRAGGTVQAFAAPDADVAWCPASSRLESSDGSVWRLDGQRVGGEAASLPALPLQVYDGVVYVDPTDPSPAPPPRPSAESPTC